MVFLTFKSKTSMILVLILFLFICLNTSYAGNYSDLQDLINNSNDTVVLNDNYSYDSVNDIGFGESGININRSLTIDGNGNSISGSNLSRIFKISSVNVVLKNIVIKDAYLDLDGGAIYWEGDNGFIINSTFINCIGSKGGVIYSDGVNFKIFNSSFINCNATYGGGVYFNRRGALLSNSSFINCSATYGGGVYIYSLNGGVVNSTFISNFASYGGGVYLNGENSFVLNSGFINNTSVFGGGVYFNKEYNVLNNSYFVNCNATAGAGVYWVGSYGSIFNSTFLFNIASDGAGVYFSSEDGNIFNSTFLFNIASRGGGLYVEGVSVSLNLSSFISNNAIVGGGIYWHVNKGLIVNSSFINNTGDSYGGAVYWEGGHGTVIDSVFQGNNVSIYNGGGISWMGSYGNIINTSFITNTAVNGGGLYVKGYKLTINSSSFISNNGTSGSGVFIDSEDSIILNSTFISNIASIGAGVYWNDFYGVIYNSSFISNIASIGAGVYWKGDSGFINNSQFTNNTGDNGSGIYWIGDNGIISNLNIYNNSANNGIIYWNGFKGILTYLKIYNNTGVNGGGVFIENSYVTLNNTSFSNNTALNGGGVYWIGVNGLITNNTFINNTALNIGGGVYLLGNSGKIEDSKLISNIATFGGGIYCTGFNTVLSNLNLTRNIADNGSGIYLDGSNLKLNQLVFSNNKAKSYFLILNNDSKVYNVTLIGGDNILNAIYNNRSVNDIYINDIHPVSGVSNSYNGVLVYQDNCEFNQSINILTYEDGVLILNNTYFTNIYGVVSFTPFTGDYIEFVKYEDMFYSEISNSTYLNSLNYYTNLYDLIVYSLENNISSISINKNYTYNPDFDVSFPSTGIPINRSLNIQGNGFTFDGKGMVSLFNINGDVNLSNLYIINHNGLNAGGVFVDTGKLVLNNIGFINNTGVFGGAVFFNSSDCEVFNSCFINNTGVFGGGVYWGEYDGLIVNSNFTGNKADNGSAIYSNSLNLTLNNLIFKDNLAKSYNLLIDSSMGIYNVTLIGGDNILNAIYNNRSVSNICINNLHPVNGADNSYNGVYIYQDSREFNQTINILVYKDNEVIVNTSLISDIYGMISYSPLMGDNITFTHESNLYSFILNSTSLKYLNTYTALYELVEYYLNNDLGVLTLKRNYTYNPVFDTVYPVDGIIINKSLIINGDSYTLNGLGLVRLFQINNTNLTLKNITITNHKNINGGAILLNNGTLNGEYLILINNTATNTGGSISTTNITSQINIQYSIILNNTSPKGSIYLHNKTIKTLTNNWWGENTPKNQIYIEEIEYQPETWFIMNFTTPTPTSYKNNIIQLNTSLNQIYNKTTQTIEKTNKTIPERTIKYTGLYNNIEKINGETIKNIIATITGKQKINATIDNMLLELEFNIQENPPTPQIQETIIIEAENITTNNTNPIQLPIKIHTNTNKTINTTITINFNNQTITQEINGETIIELKNPEENGTYPIIIKTNTTTKTIYLTITQKTNETNENIKIEIPEINYPAGENTTLNITIYENNTPIQNGNITLELNGKEYNGTIQDGKTQINITTPTKEGQYNLTIKYKNQTYNTTIQIQTPPISLNTTTYLPNKTINITIKTNITNGTLILTINNKTYTGNITNNTCTLEITTPDTGTYQVDIKYISTNTTETYQTEFNIGTIKTKILTTNLIKTFNTNESFTGYLLTEDNKPLIGYHIKLNLTRLSSGANKVYDVVTDYKGFFILPINLSPGDYTANINYEGQTINEIQYQPSNNFSTIKVTTETNKTNTILTAEKFQQPYGVGKYFTGTLTDTEGNPLPGQHIKANLTRLSSGANKVYDVVTDYMGRYKLQINLSPGEYYGKCRYIGVLQYESSNAENTITVYK